MEDYPGTHLIPPHELLKKMLSFLKVMVCAIDPAGKFVYVNDACYQLLGYRPQELLGKYCFDFMPLEERPDSFEALRKVFQGKSITTFENHYYHKDGRLVTMFWEGAWDFGNDLIYTTARDLTAQRNLEMVEQEYQSKLEATNNQLEGLVQRITDGFLALDENATVIYWNKAAEHISSLPQARMVGHSLWEVLPEPTRSLAREKLAEIKRENRPLHIEYFAKRIQRWIEVHAYISETGVSVFFRDVTERKTLEKQLMEEKVQRHREKEEEQKRITSAVIKATEEERALVGRELHDNVNQVLTTVKLYAGLCLDGYPQSDELLRRAVDLLQQTIDEIRGISKRLSAPSLGNILLKDSIRELVNTVTATNKISVALNTSGINHLELDHELHITVYRILQEHLTNILKHAEADQVEIKLYIEDQRLKIIVADNGKGFDPKEKHSGIGISNITNRAESLHGSLFIKSAPGKGCILNVDLPLQSNQFMKLETG
jgi:PAS domain S-box-containing protein